MGRRLGHEDVIPFLRSGAGRSWLACPDCGRTGKLVVVVLGGELAVPCNRQPAPAGLNPPLRFVRHLVRLASRGVDGLVLRGSDL